MPWDEIKYTSTENCIVYLAIKIGNNYSKIDKFYDKVGDKLQIICHESVTAGWMSLGIYSGTISIWEYLTYFALMDIGINAFFNDHMKYILFFLKFKGLMCY